MRISTLAIVAALVLLVAAPSFAETIPAIIDTTQQQTQTAPAQDTPTQSQPVQQAQPQSQPSSSQFVTSPPASGTAGILPVDPEEFASRVNSVIDKAYMAASPIADATAMIVLAIAGVVALFVLFSGMKLFSRVAGAVACVGLGLLLFHAAPYIVGMVKGLGQFITRGS